VLLLLGRDGGFKGKFGRTQVKVAIMQITNNIKADSKLLNPLVTCILTEAPCIVPLGPSLCQEESESSHRAAIAWRDLLNWS
jgi:hypothetical protein